MKALITGTVFLYSAISALAGSIELSGIYQGMQLYVQNSYSADGVGFCAYEVLVNGEVSSEEVNSSSFEIDLSAHNFVFGDAVTVEIRTKDECEVRVINPQALEAKTTCTYTFIGVDMDGSELRWKTEGEKGAIPFMVEQFRWNKWHTLGEVMGDGDSGVQNYAYRIETKHGENRFRVRQVDSEVQNISEIVLVVDETTPEVSIVKTKVSSELIFSHFTDYELYSEYGELKAAGEGDRIAVNDLTKGRYYVNYGNKFGEAIQKKK